MRYKLVVLAIAVLSLAGCSGGNASDTVTIRFWHSFVSNTRPALDKLIERFEAEHPGIKVDAQYVPTGDGLVRKLVASVQGGNAPDISWVHADFLGKLVQSDAIYKMRDFTGGPNGLTEEEMNDFLPGLLDAASWRDTLYALPMEATLLALLYNKDHFREAGLDPNRPPQTWDELREYALKLTSDVNGDGMVDRYGFYVPVYPASGPYNVWMNLQWTTYLWQAGGELINPEQTRVLYDSEAGVQALNFWRELFLKMGSPANSITHDLSFVSGTVSMIMDGPWDLPGFRAIRNFEWGIAPLPAGPERQVTYIAGEHLAIFKQSRNPEAAWTFVKWVTQPEIQAMFSQDSGYLPVKQSTITLPEYQEYLATDAPLKAFVDQIPLGQVRPPIDFYHVEINHNIAEAIERTLLGGENARTALSQAAAKSNELLKSAPGSSAPGP